MFACKVVRSQCHYSLTICSTGRITLNFEEGIGAEKHMHWNLYQKNGKIISPCFKERQQLKKSMGSCIR